MKKTSCLTRCGPCIHCDSISVFDSISIDDAIAAVTQGFEHRSIGRHVQKPEVRIQRRYRKVLKINVEILGTSTNVSINVSGRARWNPAFTAARWPRGATSTGLCRNESLTSSPAVQPKAAIIMTRMGQQEPISKRLPSGRGHKSPFKPGATDCSMQMRQNL